MECEVNFHEDEKTFDEDYIGKVKIFHVKSHCWLQELLCTGTGTCIGSYFGYKIKPRWHYSAGKVNLVPNNSNNEIAGYVVDEQPNNMLIVEIKNDMDSIQTIAIECPPFDINNKVYIYKNDSTLSGYRIVLFEPIILRFNMYDCRNNFWFFSNRYTKTLCTTHVNSLTFDDSYCS